MMPFPWVISSRVLTSPRSGGVIFNMPFILKGKTMAKNELLDYATSLDPAQAGLLVGKQSISEVKYDTISFAAAAVPSSTQFFASPSSDLAIKNFEGPGQLVLSGKLFLIQSLAVKIVDISAALTAQNIVDFINKTAIRLQVDQKICGTFPLHMLTGAGGPYLPSQVAVTSAVAPAGAVSNFGVENGVPQNQPFRVRPLLVEGQKSLAAYLIGPTGTPIVLAGTLSIKVIVNGLQFQPIQ